MIDSKTRLISLIGYPSRHSISPIIQNCFIRENKKNAAYIVFEFKPDKLAHAFEGMKAMGFLGFNVTMPYKEMVFEMVDCADQASMATRSVNTVSIFKDSSCKGFNTDVEGFIWSASQKGYMWKGQALVIGAGGAARSSVYALSKKKVDKIFIYNRTHENAKKVKTLFEINDRIEVIKDLSNLSEEDISFMVNCTPMGMDINNDLRSMLPVPEYWNLKDKYVMEMVYKPVFTPFLKKAISEGAKIINGIDMLVGQAAFSFKLWFNSPGLPETKNIDLKIKQLLEGKNTDGS